MGEVRDPTYYKSRRGGSPPEMRLQQSEATHTRSSRILTKSNGAPATSIVVEIEIVLCDVGYAVTLQGRRTGLQRQSVRQPWLISGRPDMLDPAYCFM